MNSRASLELPDSPHKFKKPLMKDPLMKDPRPLKYIHVHHFKTTKLFGAWFNDPTKSGKKARLFFGSHLTAYLAARAQDRAALKYKPYASDPRSIKLNFKEEDYVDDQKLRDMLTCEEFGELLRKESRPKYTKMEPTRCLRKFLAHERARGNIPSEVSPTEDIISLNRYLKEVIRKRKQLDEDMEDPSSTDEESTEDEEGSDEEMEDPVFTVEQKKHALKMERKKCNEGKHIVVSTKPRTPCSPVDGPSKCKPLVIKHDPLPVWGQTRKRSNWKRQEDETSNLQYKLQKLHNLDSTKKCRDLAPPIKSKDLPTGVENTKSLEGAPIKSEDLSIEVENMKKRSEGKHIVVSTKPKTPRSSVFGPSKCKPLVIKHDPLPVWGQTRKRSNWIQQEDETSNMRYKLQKLHLDSTKKSSDLALLNKPKDLLTKVVDTKSLEGASIKPEDLSIEVDNTKSLEGAPIEPDGLPIEVENTQTMELGNGLSEFPELQFRSRWHYKMHEIQKSRHELQTSRTSSKVLSNLPAEVENTKAPELGTEGLLPGPKFPELQTTRINEPSPTIVEDSCVQALAITLLSQVEKLV